MSRIRPAAVSQLAAHALWNSHEDIECRYQNAGWAVDHFMALAMAEAMAGALRCSELLRQKGISEAEPLRYNDYDNAAYFVPFADAPESFVVECQSVNFVYAVKRVKLPEVEKLRLGMEGLGADGEMRVYNWWQTATAEDRAEDGFDPLWFSDDEREYGPRRPSLKWLQEHAGTRYNDVRDEAFVGGTSEFGHPRDGAIHRFGEACGALREIDHLLGYLEGKR